MERFRRVGAHLDLMWNVAKVRSSTVERQFHLSRACGFDAGSTTCNADEKSSIWLQLVRRCCRVMFAVILYAVVPMSLQENDMTSCPLTMFDVVQKRSPEPCHCCEGSGLRRCEFCHGTGVIFASLRLTHGWRRTITWGHEMPTSRDKRKCTHVIDTRFGKVTAKSDGT